MTDTHPPAPLRQNDYEVIEAAVMETEKGRWFLAEYARRHRSADTEAVLGAISGLEHMLRRERRPDVDRIRLDVGEMKDAIDRTKAEIAQVKTDGTDPSRFERASNELDAIVVQTEAATSEILGAAEKLQEIAFALREEAGVDAEVCDAVEALVMTIYTACSFQDLTGQRTQKVVHVLRFLETRINAMIDIWGMDGAEVSAAAHGAGSDDARPDAHLLNGPALAGEGIDQSGVDDLMADVPVAAGGADTPAAEGDAHADLPDGGPERDVLAMVAAGDDLPAVPEEEAPDAATDGAVPLASDADADRPAGAVPLAGDAVPDDPPAQTVSGDEPSATAEDGREAAADAPDTDADLVALDLAEASAAMESALGALREVSAAVSPRPAAAPDPEPAAEVEDTPDGWAGLSRAERLALFS